ncbi:MAG: spore germination protein GerW family protein [Acutalibacteraceae bacterium]|nr:spore germination protein GerW family protein [Acutalibacteraceae bacterium]
MGNGKNLNQSSDLLNILSHTFDKVKEMADANSVLGEKIEVNNMTIIPVSKVSVGFAGGGADIVDDHKKRKQTPMGTGGSVNLTPVTFLVITENDVQLIDITATDDKKSTFADIIGSVVKQVKSNQKTNKKEK